VSDQAEILSRVQGAVAETLGIDPAEAQPDQRFFGDLGAESIDWLDLTFRLERQFAVRIPGVGNFSGVATDADGRFTAAGLADLRSFMPASLLNRIRERVPLPTGAELAEEITVDDIVSIVRLAVDSKTGVTSASQTPA
jgi:acyl carrier protein